MSKRFVGLCFKLTLLLTPVEGLALDVPNDPSSTSDCSGDYECGSRQVQDSSDPRRAPGPVPALQPSSPANGSCGSPLPLNQSYNARLEGIQCGTGGDNRPRTPMPISDEVMDKWSQREVSGRGVEGLEEMQAIRNVDEKLVGSIDFPMSEAWSYDVNVGGFNSRQCGTEPVLMTCSVSRTEYYYTTENRDDGDCIEWYRDDPVSPGYKSGGGGGTYDSGSRRDRGTRDSDSPRSRPQAPPSYKGESGGAIRERMRSTPSRPSSSGSGSRSKRSGLEPDVAPTPDTEPRREMAASCKRRQTISHRVRNSRSLAPFYFPCTVSRPKYCTWLETRHESRSCPKQTVRYEATYQHDPTWKPGYKDTKTGEVRNYSSMIPNKFDLLPGETEGRIVMVNKRGPKNSVDVSLDIKSKYNEYSVSPVALSCQYNSNQIAKLSIGTVGRLKAKAPRLLDLPADGPPLVVDPATGRPRQINLIDHARNQQLDASQVSRAFPEVEGVDPQYLKSEKADSANINAKGWWVDTQFRVQLFTKDNWGREVTTTVPNTFNSNQARYLMDSITIGLEGQGAMERFYRPSGPVEWMFENIYKRFGVELTPGRQYYLRVQMVNRGLPFYESGCTGGRRVCEGEVASRNSLSEPLDIPFMTDSKVDNRSWFKRFKDFQERTKGF